MTTMLSREEWAQAAEYEAARAFGREHKGFYIARHYAPVWLGGLLLAGAGWGLWWLWNAAAGAWDRRGEVALPDAPDAGVPLWLWVAGGVLLILSAVAFRPGRRVERAGVLILKALGIPALWLLWVGGLIGTAI